MSSSSVYFPRINCDGNVPLHFKTIILRKLRAINVFSPCFFALHSFDSSFFSIYIFFMLGHGLTWNKLHIYNHFIHTHSYAFIQVSQPLHFRIYVYAKLKTQRYDQRRWKRKQNNANNIKKHYSPFLPCIC